MTERDNPTIVLVHGGFVDASNWTPVIQELQSRGLPVLAPANPLRNLAGDSAYIASVVNEIDGPVILVGHSYGGAVITVAGASTPNVVGLVYITAFILDENESFTDVLGRFPDTPLKQALRPHRYPLDGSTETGLEFTLAPELFQATFAGDVPSAITDVAAVAQRPFAAVFDERAPVAAWKTLPSWAMVGTRDLMIHPDAQRFMSRRAGARTITEIDASHSVAVSQPKAVVDLIEVAVNATSRVAQNA
jgi:pimeloyl-ACP methyl ester carboxylesterase